MRLFSKTFFLITLLCFLYTKSIGQSVQGLNWTTDSEFLPQNSIKSIVPDKYGFIWMTTENGLVRYDGEKFEVYNTHNSTIKSNRFLYINGNYKTDSLYTTNDWNEECIFINQRKIQVVNKKWHPNAQTFDKKNENAPFTSSGVPGFLNYFPKRPYQIPLPSGNYYYIDNNTVRFLNSKKKLVNQLHFEYDSNSKFFTIGDTLFYMEKDGKYALIKNGEINWKKLDINPGAKNKLFWNNVSQQVFIFSEKKLYLLNIGAKELKKDVLIENEDLLANRVIAVYYDQNNKTIYLGSENKGLGIYKIKKFKTINPNASDMSEIFYALSPFDNNTVISSSGIIMDEKKIIRNHNLNSDKYGMVIDSSKNIWTYKGTKLLCYFYENGYKKHLEWEFNQLISLLSIDARGKIWFSLSKSRETNGTLYNFIPVRKPVFNKFKSFDFFASCIVHKDANTLLIGSNNGLYELEIKTKKILKFSGTDRIKVRNIFISEKKHIWISTYEDGFFLLRNNKVHTFPLDKNGYLLSSHCIVEDRNGFFWIPTNKGLFQVKEKALLDYADKKITTVYYHHYDKEAGFLTNEFNGGCQPCAAISGTNIFLPSINGVVTFNPSIISPIVPGNAIYLDEALLDEKKISIGDTLNLSRKFERLTLYITSPYHGNIKNQNFEAKLEGNTTTDWTNVSNDNSISYTTLAPGEYKLILRKLSGFDSNYIYKSIVIIIEPAFWETAWFKIILIALIVWIGILFYRIRIRYVKRKNLLLEKKINEQTNDLKNTISMLRATKENLNQQVENNTKMIQFITHDIKSPLRFIAQISKHMYDAPNESDADKKEKAQSIFTSSSQIFNFVDNLLEYSKASQDKEELYIEKFKPYNVIAEKIALFESIANSKKTTIKNLIKSHTTLEGNKHLFSIIIHNLLDNAIKNTYSGTILFYAIVEKNQTSISISDTGTGMSQAIINYYQNLIDNYDALRSKNNNKIGLHIVIELLLILNGKMDIESDSAGTTITLSFYNNI